MLSSSAAADPAIRVRGGRSENGVVVLGVKRRGAQGMATGAATAEATAATERERRERVWGGRAATVVEDQLWPDKHRPRDVSSLAVHNKKVRETEWV